MSDPKGYKRGEDGVLRLVTAFRRDHHDEAVWFVDGHGERFGCTKTVYSDLDMTGHLCGKTAKHDPDGKGNPTKCGMHSVAAKAKRREKAAAKYAERCAKRAAINARRAMASEASEIVRHIADGHNDPRSLCADWVARMDAALGDDT